MADDKESNVVPIKKYVEIDEVVHMMPVSSPIKQYFFCPTCGELEVHSGLVVHKYAIEDHDYDDF